MYNELCCNYDEIVNDYIDNKIVGKLLVDLMLGGGIKYYVCEDCNLVEEFKVVGY